MPGGLLLFRRTGHPLHVPVMADGSGIEEPAQESRLSCPPLLAPHTPPPAPARAIGILNGSRHHSLWQRLSVCVPLNEPAQQLPEQ